MARKALTVETHFYIADNRTAWVLLSYSSLWHKESFQKVLVMQKAKTSFMSEMVSWSSVHFSSVPWLIGSLGGHEGPFSRDSLPVLSAGGHCEQFWYGQGCPLFDVVHPAFPLLTMALTTFQGALRISLERLLRHVTRLTHASFYFLTVVWRSSSGPTRKLILFCTQSLVLCSK